VTASLAERVAEYIAAGQLLERGQELVALVSGGADSLCLWTVMVELGYRVTALHIEHGLRGAAGLADAEYCASRGAEVVSVEVAPGATPEARARAARYHGAREFADGRDLATGHTVSDQAETVLYRLASSSGPRALAAIRPRDGDLVRPLLCVTAAETRAWCAGHGLEPRIDATNDDPLFRRNLIRHDVMPALLRVHPGAEVNLARTAELLAELDELLDELVAEHVAPQIDLDALADLPRGLRVLVLRAAAEHAAGRPLRLPRELTGRLEQLAARSDGRERLSLGRDLEAVRDRRTLSFTSPTGYPHSQ
jgi:tRNA(Ile)-lysidine synthase